jgi:predicted ATPase
MHSQTDASAVVDLFDGNLEIYEKDVEGQPRRFLRSNWMHGIAVTDGESVLLPSVAGGQSRTRNNLPSPLTRLIGREVELANSWQLLMRDEIRLLTLSGPAGTGKSALSLQLARNLMDSFPDGVFLVQLAPLLEPRLVPQTIAEALGIKEESDRPLIESLKNELRERRILLLLDNFEHVVLAAPQVADLLLACPNLKLLVTSRETLRVRGEREFPVAPLKLPDLTNLPTVEALSQNAAVALFVDRAQAANPDFELTKENARAVAEICYRLDGLPLALELAAARIKILTPQTLLEKLETRLGILTRGARDFPVRQQTMRNAIVWSYDMLNDDEKKVFGRLAVFVGGFTLEAAESVCRSPLMLSEGILESLTGLVDRSLLRQEIVQEELRFNFLQTIREFSMERLIASGEYDIACRRHGDLFLALAEREAELKGPKQAALLNRLEREHDNLRAVLRWVAERNETEFGLRLAAALWRFWYVRGYAAEGREVLDKLLSSPAEPSLTRAKALLGAGSLAIPQGDYDVARRFYEEGLAIARTLGDEAGVAVTLYYLANLAHVQGNYDTARMFCNECLEMNRRLGDKRQIAYALSLFGEIAVSQGEFDVARRAIEESLALSKQLGEKLEIAMSLGYLGDITTRQADFVAAEKFYDESLTLSKELGYKEEIALVTIGRGRLARCQGKPARARKLFEESLTLFTGLGEKDGIANTLQELGGLIALGQRREQAAQAARLFGAAEVLREIAKTPISRANLAAYEHDVAYARSALNEQEFRAAWAQGRELTPEQVIFCALEKAKEVPRNGGL